MEEESLHENIDRVLRRAGWSEEDEYRLFKLEGGANNKVFKIQGPKENVFLKRFYKHNLDSRDRLFSEYAFALFAWNLGVRSLPQPICCDNKRNICVYEYVEGRKFTEKDINRDAIKEAVDFFRLLNTQEAFKKGEHLPNASEACFSILEHLRCIDRRIERLKNSEWVAKDFKAQFYLEKELSDLWSKVQGRVLSAAKKSFCDVEETLDISERCLSPSDFGFHNALIMPAGGIKFIDFEYAGWDDPAKTVCDFFCQVKIPVPMEYYQMFSAAIIDHISDKKKILLRMRLLFPVYRVKWCLILMNEFLPEGRERRCFAGGEKDARENRRRREKQLNKSRELALGIGKDLRL